jgi:hypothetical protein
MNTFFKRGEDGSKRRFEHSTTKSLLFLLGAVSLLVVFSSFETRGAAQEPSNQVPTAAATFRPCPADSTNPKPARENKKKGKSGAANSSETASACLEARASALDIQEFLQSFVRIQGWRFGEEKIAEDAWTFSRYLDKDELLRFSKEGPFAGRVNWTEGKALIQVRTRELEKGFTQVEISARFQGYGQNVDRFAPPRESWDLNSNGALEKDLISALEAHAKSLR